MRELEPASALHGNAASNAQLQAVTAALLTLGDALVRAPEIAAGNGAGLRGGSFAVRESAGVYLLTLKGLRWTEDLSVSGIASAPYRSGAAHASLRLLGDAQHSGALEVEWREGVPLAQATVHGMLGGSIVAAACAAP